MAELPGAHLVVELVLGGAEVTQIFGYLRSLGDKDVLLFADAALHHKFPPLQETREGKCDHAEQKMTNVSKLNLRRSH